MSLVSFAKLFVKPLTPLVTLAGAIASSQLANVLFYQLGSAALASLLVWAAQFLLAATLVAVGGYLIFGNSDE